MEALWISHCICYEAVTQSICGRQEISLLNIRLNKSNSIWPRVSPAWFVLLPAVLWLSCIAGPTRAGEQIESIRFARGASSAEVQGAVIRGESALYSFQARAGQYASLNISALEDNAVFQIYVPNSKPQMRDSVMEVLGE